MDGRWKEDVWKTERDTLETSFQGELAATEEALHKAAGRQRGSLQKEALLQKRREALKTSSLKSRTIKKKRRIGWEAFQRRADWLRLEIQKRGCRRWDSGILRTRITTTAGGIDRSRLLSLMSSTHTPSTLPTHHTPIPWKLGNYRLFGTQLHQ